jgi:hypothetical protein
MKNAGVRVAVTFESFGAQVCRNFNFLDKVITIDTRRFYALVREHPDLCSFSRVIPDRIAHLEKTDLRYQDCPYALKDFTACQPVTSYHRRAALHQKLVPHDAVLFGSDHDIPHFKAEARLDLRGKLTVPEAMWTVANCNYAVTIDSWVLVLACSLQIPCTAYCSARSLAAYGPGWSRTYPLLELRDYNFVCDDDD